MRAILSDIHGNLEAATAVLADIAWQGVDEVYNLGDTLGYGPSPLECLDLAMEMSVGLLGDFDDTVLNGLEGTGYSANAERSIRWTRDLFAADQRTPAGRHRAAYLAALPRERREGGRVYVHGSARRPTYESVFPEDIHNPRKLPRIGAAFDRLCFCGHTHVPGLFVERKGGGWDYIPAEDCDRGFSVTEHKLFCNVGAVGQPRDGDARACYVLFDGYRVWFRRVEYDVEATIRKVYAIPQLDDFLGDRLREGR